MNFKNEFHGFESQLRLVALYSLLLNIFLAVTKLGLFIVTGSLAMKADAIHSSVDILSSLALMIGLAISARKTSSFPYGLYKVENMVSIIISLFLFMTAYEIVREALLEEISINPFEGWIMILVVLLIPLPLLFGRYEIGEGEKASSPSLVADGSQFRADALTAFIVLLALLGQRFGIPLDRIGAIIIAIFIVKSGWGVLVGGMRVLLDASVDPGTLERIKTAIVADSTVDTLKEVTARNSGRYLFVEARMTLKATDLEKAHQISKRIEEKIKNTVPNIDRVLIHYEPKDKVWLRYAVALAANQKEINRYFLDAPYFALIDIDLLQKKSESQKIVTNPRKDLVTERGKGFGLKLAEFLISYKPDIIITRENLSGKCAGYVFAESGVETQQTEFQFFHEWFDDLLSRAEYNSRL